MYGKKRDYRVYAWECGQGLIETSDFIQLYLFPHVCIISNIVGGMKMKIKKAVLNYLHLHVNELS